MVCYKAKVDTFINYVSPLELKKPQVIFMKEKKSLIQIPEKQMAHVKGQEKEKWIIKHRN